MKQQLLFLALFASLGAVGAIAVNPGLLNQCSSAIGLGTEKEGDASEYPVIDENEINELWTPRKVPATLPPQPEPPRTEPPRMEPPQPIPGEISYQKIASPFDANPVRQKFPELPEKPANAAVVPDPAPMPVSEESLATKPEVKPMPQTEESDGPDAPASPFVLSAPSVPASIPSPFPTTTPTIPSVTPVSAQAAPTEERAERVVPIPVYPIHPMMGYSEPDAGFARTVPSTPVPSPAEHPAPSVSNIPPDIPSPFAITSQPSAPQLDAPPLDTVPPTEPFAAQLPATEPVPPVTAPLQPPLAPAEAPSAAFVQMPPSVQAASDTAPSTDPAWALGTPNPHAVPSNGPPPHGDWGTPMSPLSAPVGVMLPIPATLPVPSRHDLVYDPAPQNIAPMSPHVAARAMIEPLPTLNGTVQQPEPYHPLLKPLSTTAPVSPMSQMPIDPATIAEIVPCTGADIVARVGTHCILLCDILPQAKRDVVALYKQRLKEVPEEGRSFLVAQREEFIRQGIEMRYPTLLAEQVQFALLYNDFCTSRMKEEVEMREKQFAATFDAEELPRLLKEFETDDMIELKQRLKKEYGSSLEREKMMYTRRMLAMSWGYFALHQAEGTCSYDDMLEYYNANKAEFETPERAKWEELFVAFSGHPTEDAAWNKIAWMGNQIAQKKATFEQIAKGHSDGLTAQNGGTWNWVKRGELASTQMENEIFTRPIGVMSPIIKDKLGFHIIRVTERETTTCMPFTEAQTTIRERINQQRSEKHRGEQLENLQKQFPVMILKQTIRLDDNGVAY